MRFSQTWCTLGRKVYKKFVAIMEQARIIKKNVGLLVR